MPITAKSSPAVGQHQIERAGAFRRRFLEQAEDRLGIAKDVGRPDEAAHGPPHGEHGDFGADRRREPEVRQLMPGANGASRSSSTPSPGRSGSGRVPSARSGGSARTSSRRSADVAVSGGTSSKNGSCGVTAASAAVAATVMPVFQPCGTTSRSCAAQRARGRAVPPSGRRRGRRPAAARAGRGARRTPGTRAASRATRRRRSARASAARTGVAGDVVRRKRRLDEEDVVRRELLDHRERLAPGQRSRSRRRPSAPARTRPPGGRRRRPRRAARRARRARRAGTGRA